MPLKKKINEQKDTEQFKQGLFAWAHNSKYYTPAETGKAVAGGLLF